MSPEDVEILKSLEFPAIFTNTTIFHQCILPVSSFFNLFTLYVIKTRSPKSIGAVKNYMIWHQLCNIFTDVWITALVRPNLFYPFFVVVTNGPLNLLMTPILQTSILIGALHSTACVIVITLFYRYQTLLPLGHFLKIRDEIRIHQAAVIVFVFSFLNGFFSLYVLNVDIESEKAYLVETHPFLKYIFAYKHIYCRRHDNFLLLFTLNIVVMFTFCVMITVTMLLLTFTITDRNASAKTKRMQRFFTLKLSFQLVLPLWFLGIPGFYLAVSVLGKIYTPYSGICNMGAVFAVSTHALVSSVTTLFFWKNYRMFVVFLFVNIFKKLKGNSAFPIFPSHQPSSNMR
ncbi:unnamed protein product [Auanema sp. JU1783]|nr:unnamed protein product [Auanema sp. JU1783]